MSTYYFIPTRNIFGEGCVKETGELAKGLGTKKAMIVTDGFLAQSGMAAEVQEILKGSGVESVVFDKVQPNPTDISVAEGVELFKK